MGSMVGCPTKMALRVTSSTKTGRHEANAAAHAVGCATPTVAKKARNRLLKPRWATSRRTRAWRSYSCKFTHAARHHLDGDTWMVAGWYRLTLSATPGGGRIAGITLTEAYETGSRDLVERAQQRATA
jgi:hypothetical protein